jgi:hypothetical protein
MAQRHQSRLRPTDPPPPLEEGERRQRALKQIQDAIERKRQQARKQGDRMSQLRAFQENHIRSLHERSDKELARHIATFMDMLVKQEMR